MANPCDQTLHLIQGPSPHFIKRKTQGDGLSKELEITPFPSFKKKLLCASPLFLSDPPKTKGAPQGTLQRSPGPPCFFTRKPQGDVLKETEDLDAVHQSIGTWAHHPH